MPEHCLQHVPIAYPRLHEVDTRLAHGLAESQVGHDGGHHRVVGEFSPVAQVPGDDRQYHVAVGHPAVLVDDHEPVGVTVEGQPDPAPRTPRQGTRGWRPRNCR